MRARRWLAIAAAALVGISTHALAQDGPQPGVVTVRYFECGLGDLGDAVRLVNGDWRPIAQELIDEGMLLDYGLLTHSWGDEWNLVDYYVTETSQAFQTAWAELVRRVQARDPDGNMFEEFAELCPRHKDNIYSVVPPAP
jgi:hypothetical protein